MTTFCTDTAKVRYPDEDTAMMIKRIYEGDGHRQNAYCCEYCGGWHLTGHRNRSQKNWQRSPSISRAIC